MPEISTPATTRSADALTAAVEAARDAGLEVTDPVILHDAFSVVARLDPSPVVARVPTVLPTPLRSPEAMELRQRTELAVVRWLSGRGLPVAVPSPLVPEQPIRRNGFHITMWEPVRRPATEDTPDYIAHYALIPALHRELREYPETLPFMAMLEMIPVSLAELADHPELLAPDDLARANREWEILSRRIGSREAFADTFPGVEVQAIHGDSPPFNLISTEGGQVYSDFEDVGCGPVEWDMTMTGPDGVAAYNAAAVPLGMRRLDEDVLAVMDATRLLQIVACAVLLPSYPALAEGLIPIVDHWRTTTPAAGLT
ncbi:phosphotransferase family enzyme [Stackebrandtia albiflava]|uniref:Phosphotransferase family enzyme n=1 Tax=Stackebrandtia albiflava TaxID=406432 RepID=A0A562V4K3_9ACTN|nr:phosphotransferase [Stackebrandtia albiflava]TWJ12762.1 phosphotransferase family enzyme [Stackebrandtia albiflava]